jgi:uncharacterized repeat protein (TIGR04076 family)
MKMKRVKITVVKRLSSEEIHGDADVGCSADVLTPKCGVFEEGQEFIWPPDDKTRTAPKDFRCSGAWEDIYRHITVLAFGGEHPWMDQPGKYLACCTDGFRPVIFLLERLDD